MKKRMNTNRLILFCAALFCMLFGISVATAESTARPNIVGLMADNMRFSDLGCYGGEIMTPVINRRLWEKDEPLQESGLLSPASVSAVKQPPFWVTTVSPVAAHASVKSDLYAYYTRLDYQIPLSEIDMDVPFSNAEHIRAYRKAREVPAIPSGAPRAPISAGCLRATSIMWASTTGSWVEMT